ncbi:protocatechuate 3,4-dioxygenase [Streptomyces caatingaensis]|uniref:Protocatechuate 3,4-dioxygenase n=1 Tax=Streptomyces caatingaensis TaxID=1678637 RepID=A0A0K9XJ61_9ACTN|nr:protocatechuate 3,4-dioxygenase [Streptomyces caatingaensis]KNB53343.1 protocatechuate 3,4-dioxygenase [Streptomyces caatingaensis]
MPRRRPRLAPVALPPDPEAAELTGPLFGPAAAGPLDADLTRQHAGRPLGEPVTVSGRVRDRRGRPVRGQLVEIWQANAAGRYAHPADRNPAPLDPNFTGTGRCLTDGEGRYRFTTVRPGAYPVDGVRWRPSHIHFSLFGTAFAQRLVTQMYFPGDPLLDRDGIHHAVRDPAARARLIATGDPVRGYVWDVVLDGPCATWTEGSR